MYGQTLNKQHYYVFDALKLFFAVCVVAIHSQLNTDINNTVFSCIINLFEGCAVPSFFCFSGFLLAQRIDGKNKKEIKTTIKKLRIKYIKLYCLYELIYLPLTILGIVEQLLIKNKSISNIVISTLEGLILKGELHYSWHLWYLLSIIYATFILQLLVGFLWRGEKLKLLFISALFFATSYYINNFLSFESSASWITAISTIINSRLLTGIVFLLIGICIYDIKTTKKRALIIFATVLTVSTVIGITFNLGYSSTYIPSLIICPTLTKLASLYQSPTTNLKTLRDYSKIMYISHMYFFFICVYYIWTIEGIHFKGVICFLFVIVSTTLVFMISLFIKRIQRKNIQEI